MSVNVPGGRASYLDNPRLPADSGMAGLGLLLRFGGAFGLLMMVYLLLVGLMAGGSGMRGNVGGIGAMLVFAISGIVRSAVHVAAGGHLVLRSPQALGSVRLYVIISVVQTVLTLVLLSTQGAFSVELLLLLVASLLTWPIVLAALVFRPAVASRLRAAEVSGDHPIPRDLGIEGCGAYMTALGTIGVLFALLVGYAILASGVMEHRAGIGILLLALVVVLLIRAGVHVSTGITGIRGNDPYGFIAGVERYRVWGFISVVMVFVVSFALYAASGARGGFLQLLLSAGIASAFLMMWPSMVRGFVTNGVELPISERESVGRASDGGLTWIGYALVFQAAVGLAMYVPKLVGGRALRQFSGLDDVFSKMYATGGAEWVAPVLLAVTFWAGIELVRMTPRYKIAGIVFGLVSIPAQLVPLFDEGLGLDRIRDPMQAIPLIAAVAIPVVIPIFVLVFVNRKLPEERSLTELEDVFG